MMAEATKRHNRIVSALDVALNVRLGDGPGEALVTDMRVKAEAVESYTYPDVVVSCEDAEFEDREEDTMTNPLAIFEVLSPSTRSLDRGDKFAYYRTIPSLRHYLLVAQDRRMVDHYVRQDANVWLLTSYESPDDVLRLDPPGVELPLAEIYARVGL